MSQLPINKILVGMFCPISAEMTFPGHPDGSGVRS